MPRHPHNALTHMSSKKKKTPAHRSDKAPKPSKNPKASDTGWKPAQPLKIPSGKEIKSMLQKFLKKTQG